MTTESTTQTTGIHQHGVPCVVIMGPTASGKSDVAQHLACKLGGCVLSADSMQVYRGMDIGTGKLPVADRLVEHYGLDLVDPGQPYSAALFQTYARSVIQDTAKQNTPCIICGGTGLYIRATIDDYTFPSGEQVGNDSRDHYQQLLDQHGANYVWSLLESVDAQSAQLIHPNNTKRVIRALELYDQGKSYAVQHQGFQTMKQVVDARFFGLQVEVDILNTRIDKRVDAMVEDGLVNEVRGLLDKGLRSAITANQAIGYKEIVQALDGDISMDEAIQQIKDASHRYAKRQRTWLRKEKRITWILADSGDVSAMSDQILSELVSSGAVSGFIADNADAGRLYI